MSSKSLPPPSCPVSFILAVWSCRLLSLLGHPRSVSTKLSLAYPIRTLKDVRVPNLIPPDPVLTSSPVVFPVFTHLSLSRLLLFHLLPILQAWNPLSCCQESHIHWLEQTCVVRSRPETSPRVAGSLVMPHGVQNVAFEESVTCVRAKRLREDVTRFPGPGLRRDTWGQAAGWL